MDAIHTSAGRKTHVSRRRVSACLALVVVAGCGPPATPTYFLPPTMAAGPAVSFPEAAGTSGTRSPEPFLVPTLTVPSPTPPCTNDLTYVQDLTIPDGTTMAPGQMIDKRWQVHNTGTCNWDERYKLTLVSGDSMGAGTALPLYPARAGTEATLRILFTAPQSEGTYECQWQAVSPDGVPFGDAFYMQIVVAP